MIGRRRVHHLLFLTLDRLCRFWIVVQAGASLGFNPGSPATATSAGSAPRPAVPVPRPAVAAATTPYVPVLQQSIHPYSSLDAFVVDAQTNVNDYWLHQPFPADRQYSAPRVSLMQPGVPCGVEAVDQFLLPQRNGRLTSSRQV
jgi:hypothetical protein